MNFYISCDFVDGGCLHYLSCITTSRFNFGSVDLSFSHKRSDAFIFKDYTEEEINQFIDYLNLLPDNYKVFKEYGSDHLKVFRTVYKLHKCR